MRTRQEKVLAMIGDLAEKHGFEAVLHHDYANKGTGRIERPSDVVPVLSFSFDFQSASDFGTGLALFDGARVGDRFNDSLMYVTGKTGESMRKNARSLADFLAGLDALLRKIDGELRQKAGISVRQVAR
jgi:hypothetical protein